jgi:cytochrome b involved in lipid metabolism
VKLVLDDSNKKLFNISEYSKIHPPVGGDIYVFSRHVNLSRAFVTKNSLMSQNTRLLKDFWGMRLEKAPATHVYKFQINFSTANQTHFCVLFLLCFVEKTR